MCIPGIVDSLRLDSLVSVVTCFLLSLPLMSFSLCCSVSCEYLLYQTITPSYTRDSKRPDEIEEKRVCYHALPPWKGVVHAAPSPPCPLTPRYTEECDDEDEARGSEDVHGNAVGSVEASGRAVVAAPETSLVLFFVVAKARHCGASKRDLQQSARGGELRTYQPSSYPCLLGRATQGRLCNCTFHRTGLAGSLGSLFAGVQVLVAVAATACCLSHLLSSVGISSTCTHAH